MVSQFSPVQPGWCVLFERTDPATKVGRMWLPLLGWFTDPSTGVQPAVWNEGLSTAEDAADAFGYDAWSVVEAEFGA